MAIGMELFSSRRWRLDRPKQKAVVFVLNPKNYAADAWHNSTVARLLLLKSSMTKYLYDFIIGITLRDFKDQT